MKKLITLMITLVYTSLNTAFAFSELYYVKDVYTDNITPIIREKYESNDFRIMKADPYYGISTKNSSEYAVIILQQSGTNMFYYYQSNDNKKLNNSILKELRRQGITYEKSENANIISLYDNLAGELTNQNQTTQTNRYTFEDPKPQYQTSQYNTTSYDTQNSLRGSVAQIASGTKLNVYLQTSINTASASKGDQVTAVLMKDVIYNGTVVFPQGSLIYGTLTKAVHASYGSRNGKVIISFNQIVTPDNKSYNISTENIDFAVTNEGKFANSASNVAVGAAVGALAGLLFAALAGDGGLGKGAAIGAGVGAGGALIASTAERGVDAEIPSFTEMELVLTKPLSVTVSY